MTKKRKAQFLTPLIYQDFATGTTIFDAVLTGRYGIYSAVLKDESWLEIGFRCDGESDPWWVRSLSPDFGSTRHAAFVHDGLYKFGGYFRADGTFVKVTQEQADSVYREMAICGGAPRWRVYVRWSILRAVGYKAWNSHRLNDTARQT